MEKENLYDRAVNTLNENSSKITLHDRSWRQLDHNKQITTVKAPYKFDPRVLVVERPKSSVTSYTPLTSNGSNKSKKRCTGKCSKKRLERY
jgi:hypothetical protein